MSWPQAVLYDLDGTLADSVPDIAWSVDRTLESLGFAAPGVDAVRQWVGDGVGPLLDRALEAAGQGGNAVTSKLAMARFLDAYRGHVCVDTTLYPGMRDVLDAVAQAGVPQGVVTNKPEAFTLPLIETLGIDHYFGVCVGGDTLERRKPDPLPVQHACAQLGAAAESSIMVGDSPNDLKAGQAAGTGAILMTWGYNVGVDLSTLGADALLSTSSELIDALRSWQAT